MFSIGLMKTRHLHKSIEKYVFQISGYICEIASYRIVGNFRREKFSEISEKTNDFRKYIS